jgi:hypothetical protein
VRWKKLTLILFVTLEVDITTHDSSADSQVMDGAPRAWQLARETVERMRPKPWIVDLACSDGSIAP